MNFEYVEIFEYKNDKLYLLHSYTDELFLSINDIVSVGPTSFYVTNDHMTARYAPYNILEEFFEIFGGNVVYFDGNKGRQVASNLCFANGINVSPDGSKIYVAESNSMTLNIFKRDNSSGDLISVKKIYMNTGIDNIDVNGNELMIGSHPNLLKFLIHLVAKTPSPSQALRVILDENDNALWEDIYLDDGNFISLSSVAILYEDKLLLGTAFSGPFMICH